MSFCLAKIEVSPFFAETISRHDANFVGSDRANKAAGKKAFFVLPNLRVEFLEAGLTAIGIAAINKAAVVVSLFFAFEHHHR